MTCALWSPAVPSRLLTHLASWLGSWPPIAGLEVIGSRRRIEPGWDGRIHPLLGLKDPAVGALLSVPPHTAPTARAWVAEGQGLDALLDRLPALVGEPQRGTYRAIFRWTVEPADLPEVGRWVPSDADGVPGWLRPFGGEVLVAAGRDGTHLAGVGIKRHDRYGHELAVLTEPAARGHDLARSLVAQAARRVLEAGAVPTYLHDPSNTPSARVAEAAGFVDGGCTAFGLREPRPPAPDREPRTR